jgi:hypothetical protein
MAFSIRKVTAGSVNMTKAFMKVVVLGVVMFHCFIIEKVYCHQSRVLRRKPITLACESKGSNKCYCPQNYYSDKHEKGKICKLCHRRNYGHGSREDRPYTKKDGQTSQESCISNKDFWESFVCSGGKVKSNVNCKAGTAVKPSFRADGSCQFPITTVEECEKVANQCSKIMTKWEGERKGINRWVRPGCYHTHDDQGEVMGVFGFNAEPTDNPVNCGSQNANFVCKQSKTCKACPINY